MVPDHHRRLVPRLRQSSTQPHANPYPARPEQHSPPPSEPRSTTSYQHKPHNAASQATSTTHPPETSSTHSQHQPKSPSSKPPPSTGTHIITTNGPRLDLHRPIPTPPATANPAPPAPATATPGRRLPRAGLRDQPGQPRSARLLCVHRICRPVRLLPVRGLVGHPDG